MKICTKCRAEKADDAFGVWRGKPFTRCKRCRQKATKDWREKHLMARRADDRERGKRRRATETEEQKAAKREYQKRWNDKNKERLRRKIKANWKAHSKRARDLGLVRTYGITRAEYDAMLVAQDGRCAICGTDRPGGRGSFNVDHCHVTGNVRALLCTLCNVGCGSFGDDPMLLYAAMRYLERGGA